ncbi:hypothetical protein FHW03_003674 [Ochrobactrum sp. RH2CCR150]|nr:hypothetical protein [Ochrobactrum sp. RH2CCR150]
MAVPLKQNCSEIKKKPRSPLATGVFVFSLCSAYLRFATGT